MTVKRKNSKVVQIVDEEGFLRLSEKWNKSIARSLARGEVSGNLTPDHWKITDFVRQHYLESGTIPPVRLVVRRTGFSLACIHELFPNGYAKGICKVAGIPGHTVKFAPMLPVPKNKQ